MNILILQGSSMANGNRGKDVSLTKIVTALLATMLCFGIAQAETEPRIVSNFRLPRNGVNSEISFQNNPLVHQPRPNRPPPAAPQGLAGVFVHFVRRRRAELWYNTRRSGAEPRTERRGKNMAKPVKETPILFGEEARQFEVRMLHPKPLSPERIEAIRRDYEFLRKKCVNCTF